MSVKESLFELLPLDVIKCIALVNIQSWIRLAFIDSKFKLYAYSDIGVRDFVARFFKVKIEQFGVLQCKTQYVFGLLHSVFDKPAVEWSDGYKRWYIRDKIGRNHKHSIEYSKDNDAFSEHKNLGLMHKLPRTNIDGAGKTYLNNGMIGRLKDKPAVISKWGSEWVIDGSRDRDNDLPAVIHTDGTWVWYHRNKVHRSNDMFGKPRPAVIYKDGHKRYFIHGVEYYISREI